LRRCAGSTDVGTAVLLEGLRLIDHHCHGVVRHELDRPGFEALLSEAGAPPEGVTHFDTPLGLAVRRHCAPLLDLDPHPTPEQYLERRSVLGVEEVTGRMLRAAGAQALLVDTGYRGDELLSPGQLGAAAGAAGREIVRLESVAEDLAGRGVDASQFLGRYAETLAAADAVAVKSIAAYRVGLDFNPRPPARAAVQAAVSAWMRRGAPYRLDDPTLVRALLWTAVELGRPIQFHVGYGDADIRLHRTNPSLLTDFLRAVPRRVPVLLLHCWPYQREASYLAAVLPHVYLDVGLALNYVGPSRAVAVLAEALEVTPFGKMLYSSDAFGLPELYHLGALGFRRALAELLDARITAGEWSATDARRLARMIGVENAARVYRLPTS
jgi:predicted TIM-barrel fold metal-dependent hydrolase